MCLILNQYDIRSGLPYTGYFEAYKVVERKRSKLTSFIYDHLWKPGWNYSNRGYLFLTDYESLKGIVRTGIHVYLTKESAEYDWKRDLAVGAVAVIKVSCPLAYLVGVNKAGTEAVFTKVWLEKSEYNRTIPWYWRWLRFMERKNV